MNVSEDQIRFLAEGLNICLTVYTKLQLDSSIKIFALNAFKNQNLSKG